MYVCVVFLAGAGRADGSGHQAGAVLVALHQEVRALSLSFPLAGCLSLLPFTEAGPSTSCKKDSPVSTFQKLIQVQD